MSEIYYSQNSQWDDFLAELKKSSRVYLPYAKGDNFFYQEAKDLVEFSFNAFRPVETIKPFLFSPKEQIAEGISGSEAFSKAATPTVVVGLKNCDLDSLRVQDYVFKEGIEVDPLYALRRENTILISGDCTGFKEVCFCMSMGVLPHPEKYFDLNLSPLSDGYLVEVGSAKGSGLLNKHRKYFVKAGEAQVAARNSKRQNIIGELDRSLQQKNIPQKDILQKIVRKGYDSDTWQNFCLTCVECGACNFVCCTCHCFLLSDIRQKDKHPRLRVWDSCLYANYARVAGGANPLKRRAQRLRNRFVKKFDFFVDNLGLPACDGCGRCIEACPGKIDIREVLKDLAKNA
ncbi:4Fe-4S dicluster domain-containing protein [Candidatus Omnitrophota bacterium]